MQIIKRNCESDTTKTIELFAGTGGIAKMISEIVDDIYEKFLRALLNAFETVLGIDPRDYVVTAAIHYDLNLGDTQDLKHIVIAFLEHSGLTRKVYLAMMDATKKWTGKAWDWGLTLDQLCIYFGDRIQPEDID